MSVTGALRMLTAFRRDARAVTAIEYALIAMLVGVLVAFGATNIGPKLNQTLTDVATELSGDAPAP
jgi:Flp pilus assembly pilin Flp